MTVRPTLAILGGSFSGNKGAASMTYAVADAIRSRRPDVDIVVFSPYPHEDLQLQQAYAIADFTPIRMLSAVPVAIVALLSGRRWLPRRGPAGVLARAQSAADVSGISFMDGRGVSTLGYNALLVLLPWAFGVPIVKVAQALGPFRTPLNRLSAKIVLRRVQWIGLRGAETKRNVQDLRLLNCESAADVAFLLRVDDADVSHARDILPQKDRWTIVVPSAVVEEACIAEGIDYVARMNNLIEGLAAAGHEVMLLAHSARESAPAGRTNDLPVCRRIAQSTSARLVDTELDARVLRAVIGRSRLLVTSRFHAMISGLATVTPTFVVGWSHKYGEVLADFGLERWAVDFRQLSDAALLDQVLALDLEAGPVRLRIGERLDAVLEEAERNIDRLAETLEVAHEPT